MTFMTSVKKALNTISPITNLPCKSTLPHLLVEQGVVQDWGHIHLPQNITRNVDKMNLISLVCYTKMAKILSKSK